MHITYLLVTCVTAAAVAGSGVADLAGARFVLANAASVGVPRRALPVLAALKLAGAVGLLLGPAGLRPLAVAAGIGLVAFFVGALAVHLRARALRTIGFPGAYLALAAAALVVTVAA
jgi:hypothetical protein